MTSLLAGACGYVGPTFTPPADGAPSVDDASAVDSGTAADTTTTTPPDDAMAQDSGTAADSSAPSDAPGDTGSSGDTLPPDTGADAEAGGNCMVGMPCTDGGDASTGPFNVLISVSGLAGGASVTLQDNGTDSLTLTTNGGATFAMALPSGASYAVTVLTQPGAPAETCTVANGTGTVGQTDVTNVTVVCTVNGYTLGGTVAGLAAGDSVVLGMAGQTITASTNGPFTFPTSIPSGTAYAVTVVTAPSTPAQTCSISSGTGTVGAANVSNVQVSCITGTFTIGGTLSGLAMGDAVVLQDNAGDNLPLTANGAFQFPTQVASGQTYAVTVLTQPSTPPQTCSVSAASGAVNGAPVANVVVNCGADLTIGGTMVGLAGGDSVALNDNGGDTIFVTTNGSFAFPTPLPPGATYSVTIGASPLVPVSQKCTTSSDPAHLPSGMVGSTNVTSVTIACVTNSYTVGGTISGLTGGDSATLQNNGTGNITVTASSASFTFATPVPSGQSFNVTASGSAEPCTVTMGSGVVGASNVNVSIVCGCDPATEVTFNGQCYYLDGSMGVCDPGYALASNATMAAILGANPNAFQGLNYRHAISGNCCMVVSDGPGFENYGMPDNCNSAGPFLGGQPALGAVGCTMQFNFNPGQLTFCGD